MKESTPIIVEPAGISKGGALEELEELLEESRRECAELKDRHLRLQAEFDNFRKRKLKEADEIRQYAASALMENLLPVVDHLELALDATHDRRDPNWGLGIDLIARQLQDVLKSNGIEEISPAPGDACDPDRHEAVGREAADEVTADRVLRLVRRGYLLRGRLLRPAQVIVAMEPARGDAPESRAGNAGTEKN